MNIHRRSSSTRPSNFFSGVLHRANSRSAVAATAALMFTLAASPSHAQQLFRLHGQGSVHNGVAQAKVLAPLAASSTLDLAISLPVHNQALLDTTIDELYDPTSPLYHQYLSSADFNNEFGPTDADYNSVVSFLQQHGFVIKQKYDNRMIVDVTGSVANIDKTFHVNMNVYQHPTENRTFFGPDREPSVDQDVPILDITGLDNYELPHNNVQPLPAASVSQESAGTGPSGLYMGYDYRSAYCLGQTTLDGTGQTIGLFQLGGYYPSDISAYCSEAGLPAANITEVLLDGVSGTLGSGVNTIEQSLDIEVSHAMAPGANIRFYYGTNAADVWNQIAVDNIAKTVSSSWSVSPPPSTLNQILQQMATQGQSVFNAAGDAGYSTSPFGWDDNPYMTSVGGTNLTTDAAGGPRSSETGWSGSGGYISPNFAIPTWQQGISMTANGGSTTQRNCPDVAMVATNILDIYSDGTSGGVQGTSCAAPLWAGFMALVDQQAASFGYPTAGFINPAVYAIGKGSNYNANFCDITSGNNGKPCVTGYDLVTGWGSPSGLTLLNSLSGTPGIGYSYLCAENTAENFGSPVDAAYGANSSFFFLYDIAGSFTYSNTTFGGDPDYGVVKSGYDKPFTKCATENNSYTFTVPVAAAYGANGSYYYNRGVSGTVTFSNTAWGGDPDYGYAKAGYYDAYTLCTGENGSVTFTTPTDIAFGANGHYVYEQGVTGTVVFNDTTFADPDPGVVKAGYFRPSP